MPANNYSNTDYDPLNNHDDDDFELFEKFDNTQKDPFGNSDDEADEQHYLDFMEDLKEEENTNNTLRMKYSFIEEITRKHFPDISEEALNKMVQIHDTDMESTRCYVEKDNPPPGWRTMNIMREASGYDQYSLKVAGIKDDGTPVVTKMSPKWKAPPFSSAEKSFVHHQSPQDLVILFGEVLAPGTNPDPKIQEQAVNFSEDIQTSQDYMNLNHWSKAHKELIVERAHSRAVRLQNVLKDYQMKTETLDIPKGKKDPAQKAMGQFYGIFKNLEAGRVGNIRKSMAQSLDPDTRKIMWSHLSTSTSTAQILSGSELPDSESVSQSDRRRNRHQALKAFPFFGRIILDDPNIISKIDNGAPIKDLMAKEFRVLPKYIKAIGGQSWQGVNREDYKKPRNLISTIKDISVDNVPKTRKGWAELAFTQSVVQDYCNTFNEDKTQLFQKLSTSFSDISKTGQKYVTGGIRDYASYITDKLSYPALVQAAMDKGLSGKDAQSVVNDHDHTYTKSNVLYEASPNSLKMALVNSERWHRNLGRHNDKLETINDELKWEPFVKEIDLGNGLTAVELSSQKDLKTEGRKQDHCVGGYTGDVLSGNTIVLSIRKGKEILSTVEYAIGKTDKGVTTYTMVQNQGMGNDNLPTAAKNAEKKVKKYLTGMSNEKLDAYQEKLEPINKIYNDSQNYYSQKAGYDVQDKKSLQTAWTELSPYLPKRVQKAGLEKFKTSLLEKYVPQKSLDEKLNTPTLKEKKENVAER
jgi:hypothetical protein